MNEFKAIVFMFVRILDWLIAIVQVSPTKTKHRLGYKESPLSLDVFGSRITHHFVMAGLGYNRDW
jgi:hypothetical protein